MDSYEAHLPVSRQTTGLSFVTSVCIHALVLCVLLVSYHVQSLLLTRQLKQAVPTAQGLDRSTVIFKNPQAQSATAQNQSAAQQQQQTNTVTNNQTQPAADAATAQVSSSVQEKQTTAVQAPIVTKTDTPQPLQEKTAHQEDATDQEQANATSTDQKESVRPTTTIVPTRTDLELPLVEKVDSIPVQIRSNTPVRTRTHDEDAQARPSTTAQQINRTPWYKAASATRAYRQASASQPVHTIKLQDITRGFLKSVQQEKRTVAESNSQLSTHDMVSKSYETKVYNILQKSVLVEAKPINMHQALSTVAEVTLTIDRTGKILSFEFNHPLPRHALKAVEDQLKRAAYSTGLYPSFPRIFTQNTYRFSLPLHIEITKGQHSYRLTTNYRPL